MEARYMTDAKTGETLVFPDLLNLAIQSEDEEGGESTFVISASLSADPKVVAELPHAREMVLENSFFVLRKPVSIKPLSFQFISTGNLEGIVTLVVNAGDHATTRKKLASDIGFFDPEYSGTSELFFGKIEIAKVALSEFVIERIRVTEGVVAQCGELLDAIKRNVAPADMQYSTRLADMLLTEYGKIFPSNGKWQIALQPGQKQVKIVETKESRIRVAGNVGSIKLGRSDAIN